MGPRLEFHAFSHPGRVSACHHQLMDEKLNIKFHNGVSLSTFRLESQEI